MPSIRPKSSVEESFDLGELICGRTVIPDPLVPSSAGQTVGKTGPITGTLARAVHRSPLLAATDRGKTEAKAQAKPVVEPLEKRPANITARHLTAVIYAESTTHDLGGEDEVEKLAIGATFVNRAYYARMSPPKGKSRCYNSDFGDGTLWGAITDPTGSDAVNRLLWKEVVSKNDLKSQEELEKLLKVPTKRLHYNLSVKAALVIADIEAPILIKSLGSRVPIAFNQSAVGTPAPRWERLPKLGKHHYFYAFKAGRECD